MEKISHTFITRNSNELLICEKKKLILFIILERNSSAFGNVRLITRNLLPSPDAHQNLNCAHCVVNFRTRLHAYKTHQDFEFGIRARVKC